MTLTPEACPWSWHGLPCALTYAHPSPHHIIGEQPQFAAIEAAATKAERKRIAASLPDTATASCEAALFYGEAYQRDKCLDSEYNEEGPPYARCLPCALRALLHPEGEP